MELLDGKSGCSNPQPVNGAYLGWASADGSVLIGSQVCDGQSRFGIFRGSHFTPLPAPAIFATGGLPGIDW
jgi:hypothetical protein